MEGSTAVCQLMHLIIYHIITIVDISILNELNQAFQDINVQNDNCVNFDERTEYDMDYLSIKPGTA